MPQFTTLTSRVVPLPVTDVDTDQIIPAQFLKITDKNGLADVLFFHWRFNDDGSPKRDFVINKPEYRGARILLAGDNFGCGSSREHAPWALTAWGIRAVVSSSFADIFRSNALKNGLLPIVVAPDVMARLFALVEADPAAAFTVDLEAQELRLPDGEAIVFEIDGFARRMILDGTDELGYLLGLEERIAAYEAAHPPRFSTLA